MDINSFISAIIGGFATLGGVWVTNIFNEKNRKQKDQECIQGVLNGIHAELEALWVKYDQRMGSKVEQLVEGEPLPCYWPITQDYFTFYTENANSLGSISDKKLRQDIVTAYSELKSLIDSYRMNNSLVERFDLAYEKHESSSTEINKKQLERAEISLIKYAASLKESHRCTKEIMTELLTFLRKIH